MLPNEQNERTRGVEEHEARQTAAGSDEWERVGDGWLDRTALKQQAQAEEEEVGLTEWRPLAPCL